ncbi:MAG: type IV pilin protein [Verrucomicrobiaceae bacterium]
MKTNTKVTSQAKKKKNGFTLIEVIAVLVLLGILAAVAVPKYVDMSTAAKARAIDAAVSELNGREALTWGDESLATGGWTDDATTFAAMDTTLGSDYSYTVAATASGATISFQSDTGVALTRTASTATSPGSWSK